MLKPQDIVILIKLLILKKQQKPYLSIGLMAEELFMSAAEVHNAVHRLQNSKLLYYTNNKKVKDVEFMSSHIIEFLFHGFKYVYPAKIGKVVRGIPTAMSASVIKELFVVNGLSDECVWPYEFGDARGQSLEPLYKTVPKAVKTDKELYEFLSLLDVVRIGKLRERKTAEELLRKKLQENFN
jgi:hypothetical protein